MKEKNKKEYLRKTKKLRKIKATWQKPHQMDKHLTCPPRMILGTILKVNGRTSTNGAETRKRMTMHKALDLRDYVDGLHMSRNEGKGFTSMEDSVDISIRRFDYYIKKSKKDWLQRPETTQTILINGTTMTRKQKWKEKKLYWHFTRQTNKISHEKTWTRLRKGNFKRETECLLIDTQNNVIRINYVKAKIDKTQPNSKWDYVIIYDQSYNKRTK